MFVLVFLIGALLGLVLGAAICIRYLRQELTARIGPTMDLLQLQLQNLQTGVNIALANWHAELHRHNHRNADKTNREADDSITWDP
ncbi:MAG: hypothetical protein LC776_15840 [Acidobacteria bacterium]|nr:hypothetical protein [Acidobacteriota bacterium]